MSNIAAELDRKKTRIPPIVLSIGAPIIGCLAGLLIGALLIMLAGADPIGAYKSLFLGAFGGKRQLTETILHMGPLLLIGLGLTAAFRARVWNIGAEGQYYIGALLGGVVALYFYELPRLLLIVTMLLAGILGGALWGLIPVILKIKKGMNEIISTLMLNYIAILFLEYLARGPLQDPDGYLPTSAKFDAAARLPMIADTRIHIGILISILLVPVVYAFLWATPLGFKLRSVGSKASVARYAGIKVEWIILFALVFSGALAGLAGVIEVSSRYQRLKAGISLGYGFSGILVALLGRLNPIGVALAALFFAALDIGAEAMHVSYKLPVSLAGAIQAIIVLSVLAVDAFVHWRRS